MSTLEDRLKTKVRQGVNSKTWTPPPFYGDLTVPDLYAFHAEHRAEHPVIVYDDEHGEEQTLRHRDVFKAIQKAAELAAGYVQRAPSGAAQDNTVLGILAVAGMSMSTPLLLQRSFRRLVRLPHALDAHPGHDVRRTHAFSDLYQELCPRRRTAPSQDVHLSAPG